jgi:hypothetical protein
MRFYEKKDVEETRDKLEQAEIDHNIDLSTFTYEEIAPLYEDGNYKEVIGQLQNLSLHLARECSMACGAALKGQHYQSLKTLSACLKNFIYVADKLNNLSACIEPKKALKTVEDAGYTVLSSQDFNIDGKNLIFSSDGISKEFILMYKGYREKLAQAGYTDKNIDTKRLQKSTFESVVNDKNSSTQS